MKKLVNIYKPIGMTPYQLIVKLKTQMPEYKDIKIGFAGRLDPLAHGVMLLMVGEETKQRANYLALPKEYEFEALFGLQTDTYDLLGVLQELYSSSDPELVEGESRSSSSRHQPKADRPLAEARTINLKKAIEKFIKSKLGSQTQPYPPFSSKTVLGKPLYWWTRNNKLSEIKIPQREIEIYNFELLSVGEITNKQLQEKVKQSLNVVKGDFRQKEIGERWESFFRANKPSTFPTAKFRIHCSSGTYVRGLVNELGNKLNIGAVTLDILRTRVGEYSLSTSIKL